MLAADGILSSKERTMLCERCHKNLATLKYTEVVNGKAFVRSICETCLHQLQDNATSGFEISGSAPAPKRRTASDISVESVSGQEVCATCGTPQHEVIKLGRAGCRDCYSQFERSMEPLLRGQHTALRHRGKVLPHMGDDRSRLRTQLQTTRALLRSALKTEDYEKAANLRDQIRNLESTKESVDG
jgi:protein arginine kinase activator